MPLDERQEMYEQYLESVYKQVNLFTKEQYEQTALDFKRVYQDYLPKDKDCNILEVGCGCGSFLYYLEKEGYQNFLGIDISTQQVEFCKKNITEHVQQANAMEFLKNKTEFYDVMVSHDVLEHIPKGEVRMFLGLIHKALKKGGIFIARVPNMSNPFGIDARYNDFTHETGFTAKSLYQLFWSVGYRDINILPSQKIQVRSFRNFVRRILVSFFHKFLKFLYYIQDYSVPQNLDKNLVVIVKKE